MDVYTVKKASCAGALKNAMERENANKLYVGVVELYNTFHKLAIERET